MRTGRRPSVPAPLPTLPVAPRTSMAKMMCGTNSSERARVRSHDSGFSKILPGELPRGGSNFNLMDSSDGNDRQERQVSVDSSPESPRTASPAPGNQQNLASISVQQTYGMVPLECWKRRAKTSASRTGQRNGTSMTQMQAVQSVKALKAISWHRPSFCALSPNGHFRNFWDFLGVVFLVLDAIILPLQFVIRGFYEELPLFFIISKIEVFYWCLDLILSFFTGYLHKGDLISKRRAIARRYLKTWFLPEHILRGGALCAWCLVAAIHKMDCSDILLPSDQAKEFHSLLIQHLLHWQGLAQHYQYSQHVKRWKLRPKHHDCEHLAKFVAQTRINPRHTACWQDESYLGQIKKIAVHCHMSSVLLRVFQRLILNLSQRWHTERSQTQGS